MSASVALKWRDKGLRNVVALYNGYYGLRESRFNSTMRKP